MKYIIPGLILSLLFDSSLHAWQPTTLQPEPAKPRVLISSDIGGTDPDDNQSMIHFLMYSDRFDIEGIVSSPSYGEGNKEQVLRVIDLYEKDLPRLKQHGKDFPSPEYLRSVTQQGRHGGAPYSGYTAATEGSDWIIRCAERKSDRPLWVLVWGGLDDVAQALHDAPGIRDQIRIYWIGGPNKKWSTHSYAYIAENFPNLWFIEANASYRGFFSNSGIPDSLHTDHYYDHFIRSAGHLGKEFRNYYNGRIKMGDTPALLYLMDGDPNDPRKESWGGSFTEISHSSREVFRRNTTLADTVPVYSILEFHLQGPDIRIPRDSACFTLTVAGQDWEGFCLGDGEYAVRYSPKKAETLKYSLTSGIPGFKDQQGVFVVENRWPGPSRSTDFALGDHWYSDRSDPSLFDGMWQGAKTVLKWRNDAMQDWAKRWNWLK
jgi:hypothetical protein